MENIPLLVSSFCLFKVIWSRFNDTSMIRINRLHHIAIICSDFEKSKAFYTDILGFTVIREVYRENSSSFKLDLALHDTYVIELFSFPHPPPRLSFPEATGLRHLALEVDDLEATLEILRKAGVSSEPVRMDETTGKRFTFIADPDQLPLELYENNQF